LRKRGGIQDPMRALVQRILNELSNPEEKYRLFVRAPIFKTSPA